MKTIFFLNSYPEWGGGEKWTYEVAEELNNHNEYNVIVGSIKTSKLYQKADKIGIKTKVVPVTSSLSVLNLYKLFSFVKYLKQEKIDVLILNLSQDLKFGAIAAKLAGVEKIIYRRGSAIPIKDRFYTRFLLDSCVTDIIANSISTKETILQNTKEWLDESKIQIIYNGIKMDEVEN
ncbi:MAG: glycosyltransferase, partial [Halanaerobiales bacterium]